MTDALDWLTAYGEKGGDLAEAALMLSRLDHPNRPLEPARAHLAEIAEAMKLRSSLIRDIGGGAHALADLLFGQLGYEGDREDYDNPQNADLVSVIARRRGLPVALGILYIHGARAAGMAAAGLNAPNHFVVRLTHDGHDAIVDPFNGGALIEPDRAPPHVPIDNESLTQVVSDASVLLRLQNNLKIRALDAGDDARALEIAERMVLISPKRPDLWFDLGRLRHQAGIPGAARKAYEHAVAQTRASEELGHAAREALAQLKRLLN